MNVLLPENRAASSSARKCRSGCFSSEAAVIEEVLALLKRREHARDQQNAANKTGVRPIGEIIKQGFDTFALIARLGANTAVGEPG